MAPQQPVEGQCVRCEQSRPVFPYKPLHNCIDIAGNVSLLEAADWISEIEMTDDRWCQARLQRRERLMCVPCHDREATDEERHVQEHAL